MKVPLKVIDIEGNEYCMVEKYKYVQMENSVLDFDGFYGYIENDKFISSTKRRYLDPKILFVEVDIKKINLKV